MYDIAVGTLKKTLKPTSWVSGVHKIFWQDTTDMPLFWNTYTRMFGNFVEVVGMGLNDEKDFLCESDNNYIVFLVQTNLIYTVRNNIEYNTFNNHSL